MKPYFAKYLPVPGEIKKAKKVLYKGEIYNHIPILNNKDREVYTFIMKEGDERGYHEKWTDLQEVQLFLCSRDIKVGDKARTNKFPDKEFSISSIEEGSGECSYPRELIVWNVDENANAGNCKFWRPVSEVFKVIGLISPEATWVKEGDEFEESDWDWRIKDRPPYRWDVLTKELYSRLNDRDKQRAVIGIKGPCGHFH